MRTTFRPTRLLLPAILLLASACMHAQARPADLDLAREHVTANGMYRAAIRPEGDSIPGRRLHRWIVTVQTPDGAAVDSARITVDGGMPQHGHGLPTSPRVTRALGNGAHLVDGVKFSMGGWWELRFRIAAAAGTDSVTFNLSL